MPVAFELRFAGAARADAAAEARHLFASSGKTRQAILELRELDLDATLARPRVLREDIEDHGGPIDHGGAGDLLECPLLRWLELVVADHDVHA